jgi:hypothetical protein
LREIEIDKINATLAADLVDLNETLRCKAGNLVAMGCSFAGPAKARC